MATRKQTYIRKHASCNAVPLVWARSGLPH